MSRLVPWLILFNLFLSLQDESDVVFRATTGKWQAVVVEISRMNKTGRPVLVGTTSVEQSDTLSKQLREAGIPHEVIFHIFWIFSPRNGRALELISHFHLEKIHSRFE